MASTLTTPYEFATELLAVAAAALVPTSGGAIARAYVCPGVPAIDCETLAVSVLGLGLDQTTPSAPPASGQRLVKGGRINLLSFLVTIARDCIPVVSDTAGGTAAPTPDQLSAASNIVLQDVWAVWAGIGAAARSADGLFEGQCSILYLDAAVAIETQGMTAGWTIALRTQINGIPRT